MHKKIPQHYIGYSLIFLLFAGSAAGYAWNRRNTNTKPAIFYSAMQKMLTMPGISCEIITSNDQSSSNQKFSIDLEGKSNIKTVTSLSDNGNTVVTVGLSTKNDDYVRYTSIKTTANDAQDQPLDFKSVLGVWGKQPRTNSAGTQLFEQMVLGGCVVPMADLDHDKATGLITEERADQAFRANFDAVPERIFNKLPVYAYDVTLTGTKYIDFMKKVAKAYGLNSLDKINADAFAKKEPENLKFMVHRRSHQLVAITYNDQNRSVRFTGHGNRPEIVLPKNTIPTTELQKRLAAIR